jgi:hypothetical protein
MNEDGPLCAHCQRPAIWDFQDTAIIGGQHYVERALICADGCDWTGSIAMFKTRGASDHDRARGIGRRLPADPFDDAVPMLAPRSLQAADVLDVQRIADLCASHAMARLRTELAEQMRATGFACQIALADALERG